MKNFEDFSAIVATFNINEGRGYERGRIILAKTEKEYVTWLQQIEDGACFSGNYFSSKKEGEKDFLRRVLTHTGFGIHLDEGKTGIWKEVEK